MRNPLNVLQTMRKALRARRSGAARCDYLPLHLIVETSSRCNLRCPMCPASLPMKLDGGLMKFDTFKRVIDESATFVSDIELSHRGEPLLNRHLPEMIAYADEKRIATSLSTNATHLTEELALRLIESGLRSITFSVDGLDRDAYRKARVGANFDEVLNSIVDFLRMKRRLRSRTPWTMIETLDLPDAPFVEEKGRRFLGNFRSLPLDKFVIRQPHNWAGSVELSREREPLPSKPTPYHGCPFIWDTMVVLWDGSAALCPQDWYNDNPLGNINDSSLREMWNGWTLTFVRQLLADGEYNQIEVCSQCDLLWRRHGWGLIVVTGKGLFFENTAALGQVKIHNLPLRRLLQRLCSG